MNDNDFLSVAIGFASAAPVGILALWFILWRARTRVPKWHGWDKATQAH
jgi:hypothetical protein